MDPLLIGFLAIAIVGLFIMNSRARKRQQQATAFRDTLQPGQEVMTASGLFGTVVAVEGDRVTLASAGGHETVWLNAAIAKLVEPETPADDDDDATDDEVDGVAPVTATGLDAGPLPDPVTGPESAEDPRLGRPDDTTR